MYVHIYKYYYFSKVTNIFFLETKIFSTNKSFITIKILQERGSVGSRFGGGVAFYAWKHYLFILTVIRKHFIFFCI